MLSMSRLDLSMNMSTHPGHRLEELDDENEQQEMQKIVLFLADFLKTRNETLLEVAIEGETHLCVIIYPCSSCCFQEQSQKRKTGSPVSRRIC